MNIDCCSTYKQLNQGTSSGMLKISYIKFGLLTKFKFTKYGKAVNCLWWALAGSKKQCLLNVGTVNQDVTVAN